jgi:HK97 family phage major capsid protein
MEIKQIVDEVGKKLETFKDSVTAANLKELKELTTQFENLKTMEFKALKDELVEKGATLGQLQEEVKALKAARNKIGGSGEVIRKPSIMGEIAKVIEEKKEKFMLLEKAGRLEDAFEIKAPGVVLSTSLANGSYIDYLDWRPGMEPTGQFRIRELVRTVASAFDTVYFPVANVPVGQGSFGRQVTEGATKAQVDRGYTMATLNLTPMAAYIQVSRQSLRNIPFLQTWLPTSLNEQLLDTEDLDFMSKIVSAATGNAVVKTAGGTTITVAAEVFIYLIKNLRQAKYVPTGIACDPAVWAEVLTTKPQNYSVPFGYNIDQNGMTRVMGIPLFPANWLTGGRVIAADWTKAVIVESEALSFRQSDNVGSTFIANELTFLLERTNNLGIYRTDAFATTTVS